MSNVDFQEFVLRDYKVGKKSHNQGKTIGQGTFGKVRLAVHIPTDQKVAVKTLQKQKIVEPGDIQRVTRQIGILKVLRHPNVIQLYQIIETQSDIHLIMEYAQGGELFDFIVKNKRLDQKEAFFLMEQILSGVQHIHKNGIVHRDLKPENLLFDQHHSIKIVDFGLSNTYKQGQKLKTACGSPCYAAPQMIAGKRYECKGVDVWSCGIILYAMLCGYLPFQDPNTSKLYKKIMQGEFELPKMLSIQSKSLLKSILDVNPQTRFKIGQIRQILRKNARQYQAPGILIGTDTVQINEDIIKYIENKGSDGNQIKKLLINNKHNHLTTYYYLLQNKIQKNALFASQFYQRLQQARKNDSPLIYRPQSKKITINEVKVTEKKNQDDSFNTSYIINSLASANSSKTGVTTQNNLASRLVSKNGDHNFSKAEHFKLFPKKKDSSIYDAANSQTFKSVATSRTGTQQKHMDSHLHSISLTPQPKYYMEKFNMPSKVRPSLQSEKNPFYTQRLKIGQHDNRFSATENSQQMTTKSKRQCNTNANRQQIAVQIKQITAKLDKSINELQNHKNQGQAQSKMLISKHQQPQQRIKTQFNYTSKTPVYQNQAKVVHFTHLNTMPSQQYKEVSILSKSIPTKNGRQEPNIYNVTQREPKVHVGPFNASCLFQDNPKSLIFKIMGFLNRTGVSVSQADSYTLSYRNEVIASAQIQVKCLGQMKGFYIVSSSFQGEIFDKLLDFLNH